MTRRIFLVVATASLLAASHLPASAQVVDDFLCSTFSYKCATPPPPPPPVLAPAEPPIAATKPAKRMHKKKVKRTPAPKDAAAPSTAAPDAAPK